MYGEEHMNTFYCEYILEQGLIKINYKPCLFYILDFMLKENVIKHQHSKNSSSLSYTSEVWILIKYY